MINTSKVASASASFLTVGAALASGANGWPLSEYAYYTTHTSSSFTNINQVPISSNIGIKDFSQEIGERFYKLSDEQADLGTDFRNVIEANLADLYEYE